MEAKTAAWIFGILSVIGIGLAITFFIINQKNKKKLAEANQKLNGTAAPASAPTPAATEATTPEGVVRRYTA